MTTIFSNGYPIVAWDIARKLPAFVPFGKDGETGRGFKIKLMQNQGTIVPTEETMKLYAEKPDGTHVYINAVKDGDTFRIDLTTQIFTVAGTVTAHLELNASGKTIYSNDFTIIVDGNLLDGSIESSNEFTALQDALSQITGFESQLTDMATLNIATKGIISDGVTDQTSAILALFSGELATFKGTILIPYKTKFNLSQIFQNAPVDSVIDDRSVINMYNSPSYKQKTLSVGSSDLVNNDFMYQILSGHHPALLLNNLGTSGSVSAGVYRGSILFAHGFNADGTQKNHMMLQSYKGSNGKWLFTLAALNLGLTNQDIDSTVWQVDDNGNMGINGLKSGYNVSFQDSSFDAALSMVGGIFNRKNNSKAVWALGSKKVDGTEVITSLVQNPDGRLTIEQGGNVLFSIDENGVMLGKALTIGWKTISGAIPDVTVGKDFFVNNASAVSMTDMTGGNQEVRLVFQNANTTLVHGSLKLKGSVNWTPTAFSSITFVKNSTITGAWIEVGRTEM